MEPKQKKTHIFFYILMAIIILLSLKVVGSYVALIILSVIIVSIFRPLYNKLLKIFKGSVSIATSLSILSVILTLLLPVILLVNLSVIQFSIFYEDFVNFFDIPKEERIQDLEQDGDAEIEGIQEENDIILDSSSTNDIVIIPQDEAREKGIETEESEPPFTNNCETTKTNAKYQIDDLICQTNDILNKLPGVEYTITLDRVQNFIIKNIQPLFSFAYDFVRSNTSVVLDFPTNAIVFIYLLVALFPNLDKIITFVKKLSPLSNEVDEMYISRFLAMSHAMVKGQLVIAVVQGIVSGIVLWLLGVQYVIFLTILMIFLSIIPLGAGFINFPIAFIFFASGNYIKGLLILLNHFLLVTNIDNFLRPKLVPKNSELHPVLVLIAVLGGIKYFGFFGFIFGPVVIIFLVTTLQVYMQYYKKEDQ